MVGGLWCGWYVENNIKIATAYYLEQHWETMHGWGGDRVGVFAVSGAVSKSAGRVAWLKTYLGGLSVKYSGTVDSAVLMRGLW